MTINEFLQGDKFALLAGVELLETGNGYAKARMEIKPEHLNGGGVCQGGAIFTLADLAFAAATNSHARLTLSITSSINFFKAESKGFLYAEAREAFSHKRLANCEVRITNETGDLIATFNGTGYYLPERLSFTFDPLFHAGAYYVQEASSMFLEQAIRSHVKTPLLTHSIQTPVM